MEFEALANQHKDEIYRQMIRACGNREDAEDVLVEALVKAHRHLGQLRDAGAFRAWLAQIARRVCWQLKKREALQPLLQLSVVEEEGREIASDERPLEQQIALRQMSSLLHEAVDKLSEEYRSVYLWRDLEDVLATEADIVTASALFDLASADFIAEVAARVARSRAVFYTVLTYNGVQRWTPKHVADARGSPTCQG